MNFDGIIADLKANKLAGRAYERVGAPGKFRDRVTVAFGIGTYIANDTCEEPLNIVMKTTACNGMDVAKISDTPGKEMCKNADYVDYLTRCIRWRLEHDR